MGLSASQARLLSITARLTDNEYHSQQIANAKMRLAGAQNDARTDYQNALNSTMLVYNGFDTEGNATSTTFTPNVIYQYQPLKNQYALLNTAGQVLVTNTDAKNYAETDNLADFLDRYGVLEKSAATELKYKEEEVKVKNPQYDEDWAKWNEEWDKRKKDYDDRLKEIENWEPGDPPKQEDYKKTIVTFTFEESTEAQSLYEMFKKASKSCFDNATIRKSKGCYAHVLAHMLDLTLDSSMNPINYPKTITTTTGKTMSFGSDEITGSAINGDGMTPYMKPVSDVIRDGWDPKDGSPVQTLYVAEHPDPGDNGEEWDKLISDHYVKTGSATELQKLMSNYKLDASGNLVRKKLEEKCKDLYYVLDNQLVDYDTIMIPFIKSFQYDMDVALKGLNVVEHREEKEDKEAYEEAVRRWKEQVPPDPPEYPEEPPKPTTPEYLIEKVQVPYTVTNWNMELNDLEKAQWYTNLWYKMNGQDEPDRIQIKEGVEDNTDYYRKYILDALDVAKNEFTQAYQVLDVNLASSSTWLQDVLSQGIVVMQRVNNDKTNPQYKYNWTDIIYTDASELTQEQDEVAVSRAEVAYEEKMKEIEAKDKRYQLELNKLDSEHNALQTQIDSIRSEISKNVERSFKAFS